jgi:hypothetical protein
MDEMTMKRMKPGAMHEYLAPLEGEWSMTVKMRMTPEAPWEESEAQAEREWILDGRFMREEIEGEFAGMPFEGLGYTGHDNHKKKYMGTWMDNMSTAVMVSEGTFDNAGKVMTSTSTMDDFMTGKATTLRMITTMVDADQHLFEMYGPDPTGKEVKQMEIRYKRRK